MKKISMEQLDDLLKSIYYGDKESGIEGRPFGMYLHGCDKKNAEFLTSNPLSKFHVERNSIASTVVNGGRPTVTVPTGGIDYKQGMDEYVFAGKDANLVLIMPDRIAIDRYCGAAEGQLGVTRGYGKHIELDYLLMAGTQIIDRDIKESPTLQEVKNCFILGYYDHENKEFALNENCLLLQNTPEFDSLTGDIRELANKQYDNALFINALRHAYLGGCPNPIEAEQIVKNEQLNDILREQAHITYMQSAEAQLDANVYNTDLLIDYDHLTPSATYQALDQMAANMEQGMTQDLDEK